MTRVKVPGVEGQGIHDQTALGARPNNAYDASPSNGDQKGRKIFQFTKVVR